MVINKFVVQYAIEVYDLIISKDMQLHTRIFYQCQTKKYENNYIHDIQYI